MLSPRWRRTVPDVEACPVAPLKPLLQHPQRRPFGRSEFIRDSNGAMPDPSRLKPLIWTSPVCKDGICWLSECDCSLIFGSLMGNNRPLAMMVCARADSFTPTRPLRAERRPRSVDVGPTDSPSSVVFAIVGRLLRCSPAVVNRYPYCALAIIAQA